VVSAVAGAVTESRSPASNRAPPARSYAPVWLAMANVTVPTSTSFFRSFMTAAAAGAVPA
jgi:hypothetical protein